MPTTLSDQIAAVIARKATLDVRLNRLEARAKQEDRKRDTRRKIVVGAAVLAALDKDPELDRAVRRLLAVYVLRENDRDVIADLLAPSPAPAAVQPVAQPDADSSGARFARASSYLTRGAAPRAPRDI